MWHNNIIIVVSEIIYSRTQSYTNQKRSAVASPPFPWPLRGHTCNMASGVEIMPPQRVTRARARELAHLATSSCSIWSAIALIWGLLIRMALMKSCKAVPCYTLNFLYQVKRPGIPRRYIIYTNNEKFTIYKKIYLGLSIFLKIIQHFTQHIIIRLFLISSIFI